MSCDVIVDLSHWNAGPIDFVSARVSGIAGVILKATQGTRWVDPAFASRAAAAARAGLLVGAYHFFGAGKAIAQADHFLDVALGVPLLALDFEPSPATGVAGDEAARIVTEIGRITGRAPLLYTGRWDIPYASDALRACPLWLAAYVARPVCPPGWDAWTFWQHTDGRLGPGALPVPGIGACDRSYYAGTPTDLAAWWGR